MIADSSSEGSSDSDGGSVDFRISIPQAKLFHRESPAELEGPAAAAFIRYNATKFRTSRREKPGVRVFNEFESRPSGLYFPRGLVAKRIDASRVERVAWKVVRGLYHILAPSFRNPRNI